MHLENRKVFHLPIFMVEVQEYPLIQPYGASCGWLEHNRWFSRGHEKGAYITCTASPQTQVWMSRSPQV